MKFGLIARLKNRKKKKTTNTLQNEFLNNQNAQRSEMKNNTEMDLFHDENIDLQAQKSMSSAGFLSFRVCGPTDDIIFTINISLIRYHLKICLIGLTQTTREQSIKKSLKQWSVSLPAPRYNSSLF